MVGNIVVGRRTAIIKVWYIAWSALIRSPICVDDRGVDDRGGEPRPIKLRFLLNATPVSCDVVRVISDIFIVQYLSGDHFLVYDCINSTHGVSPLCR
jgi:hypothetical protein